MALTIQRKNRLAQLDLPDTVEVRRWLEQFMLWTGFNEQEVGEMLIPHYSRQAVNHFHLGRYVAVAANEGSLLLALKELKDSHPITRAAAADTAHLHRTAEFQQIRKAFYGALDNGWAYCIDGAPGTGKTYSFHALCAELERVEASKNGSARRAVYIYCRVGIRPLALLQRIAMAAGVPARGNIDQLIRKLQYVFATRRLVLLLDEAQHLDGDGLETVRELLDRPPYIGLIFGGSHDVQRRFATLEQLRRRMKKVIELSGFTRDEAEAAIRAELGQVTKEQIEKLIKGATVPDARKGRDVSYISAGTLFDTIAAIQRRSAAKAGNAE